MLLLFGVVHFPPPEYEEAVLYPEAERGVNGSVRAQVAETSQSRHSRGRALPDGHILVDVVDISEHDLPGQHREGEGACDAIRNFISQTGSQK